MDISISRRVDFTVSAQRSVLFPKDQTDRKLSQSQVSFRNFIYVYRKCKSGASLTPLKSRSREKCLYFLSVNLKTLNYEYSTGLNFQCCQTDHFRKNKPK